MANLTLECHLRENPNLGHLSHGSTGSTGVKSKDMVTLKKRVKFALASVLPQPREATQGL